MIEWVIICNSKENYWVIICNSKENKYLEYSKNTLKPEIKKTATSL